MTQGHSPEPWRLQKSSHDSICDANGNRINKCEMSEHLGQFSPRSKMRLDDRERIVACVNACAGIPTGRLIDPEYVLISVPKSVDQS